MTVLATAIRTGYSSSASGGLDKRCLGHGQGSQNPDAQLNPQQPITRATHEPPRVCYMQHSKHTVEPGHGGGIQVTGT